MTSTGPQPWGASPVLIAHRVGNTPEAVAAALAAGADIIEADLHLYRRRIEVRHTKSMGVLPWLWDRWYLVPASAPRLQLRALVAALPGDTMLMLDLKGWHPWLGRVVAAEMEAVAPGRPYAVAGRAWSMFDAFESHPHVRIIHSAASPREARALRRRLTRHRTDAVCLKQPVLADARLVDGVRPMTPALFTWPVGSTDAAERALHNGAHGLIIDGVELLADIARRHRRPRAHDA